MKIGETTRFGVELPKPEVGKHITISESYIAWYNFYSNHFNSVLNNEQWNEFRKAQKWSRYISFYA